MLEDKVKDAILNIVDNIDVGNSHFDNDDALEVIDLANRLTNTQNKLSKYQACKYLHCSRATFDNGVRDGKLPKGKKEQGFKELFGEMSELKEAKAKLNKNNHANNKSS